LAQLGATVSHVPVIETLPPDNPAPLDTALAALDTYHWLVFTSANGVEHTLRRAAALGLPQPLPLPAHLRVCAIGPATRQAALAAGLPVHLVPEDAIAEGLARAFAHQPLPGKRVLLVRAATGRDVAPEALRAMGATVDVVATYRTALPAQAQAQLQRLIRASTPGDSIPVNWVLFTSGSTVKNFLAIGGAPLLHHARAASIGPATSAIMRKHGLAVHVEATQHDAAGIVDALVQAVVQALVQAVAQPVAQAVDSAARHASMEDSHSPLKPPHLKHP
jgi:uroporphyrinogen-III synthase